MKLNLGSWVERLGGWGGRDKLVSLESDSRCFTCGGFLCMSQPSGGCNQHHNALYNNNNNNNHNNNQYPPQ